MSRNGKILFFDSIKNMVEIKTYLCEYLVHYLILKILKRIPPNKKKISSLENFCWPHPSKPQKD